MLYRMNKCTVCSVQLSICSTIRVAVVCRVLHCPGLCRDTSSHEVFLLSCAALANMSLLDTMTFDFLMLSSTVQVLIDASSRHVTHSLFVKDQVRLERLFKRIVFPGLSSFFSQLTCVTYHS
jgi:Protein inscuteable C-terminal